MQAVILAGGKGSRLGGDVPKPLIEVGGKPLIGHITNSLIEAGTISETIIVGTASIVKKLWFDAYRGYRLVVQPEPLGTGDALRWAYPYIRGDFLLLGADTIFQTEDIAKVCNAKQPVGLAIADGHRPGESALRFPETGIVRIAEKYQGLAAYKSLMLYKLPLDIFWYLPRLALSSRGEYEVQDAINWMLETMPSYAYSLIEVGEYHHVTTGADVDRINRILSRAESAYLQR